MTAASGGAELFGAALKCHRAGRLAEAEAGYRHVLAAQPNHADALHLLGTIAHQLRRDPKLAVELIDQALALKPGFAVALNDRGNALQALDRNDEALASYDKALALQPHYAEAYYNRANLLQKRNRLDEALASYDETLALRPDHAAAFNNRGLALQALGRFDEALANYGEAQKLKPGFAEASYNRGNVLQKLNRIDEAVASYDRALAFKPYYPEAFYNRGNALQKLSRFDEALASYDRALALKPHYAEVFNNRAVALQELGRLDEALASYDTMLALKPHYAEAHYNRGSVLRKLNRNDEALASYDTAIALDAHHAEAFYHRGTVLQKLNLIDEALASYDKALALKPDHLAALNSRGDVLQELKRYDEALSSYDKALTFTPHYAETFNNRGIALAVLRRIDEALASYDNALALKPDFAEAHTNLGCALMLAGRFKEGWQEYEWRWNTVHQSGAARDFPVPLWCGEPIGNRVILLHAEQGFGDTLQFCRYVPRIAADARTVLEVQAPLVRLLSRLPGISAIVPGGDKLPSFDLHCPLVSLPRVLGTTLETIPSATPYLAADPARAADWRRRLAGLDGLKVGLVWAGGTRPGQPDLAAVDRRRSIALDTMAPLGEVSGASFISLQTGPPAAQAASPPPGMELHDFTADLHDFEETAALIDGIDLVISVDTAVVHLAGALGKPVWLLNRFDTCWRWLLNRDDSPWYPLLRQFRQPSPGDWNSVICSTRDALIRLAAGDCDQLRPRGMARV